MAQTKMKTVQLSIENADVESTYARSHDCQVVSVDGVVTVMIEGIDEEVLLECSIQCQHNTVTTWEVFSDTEGVEVECSKEYAQELLEHLMMDGNAETNFY